MKLKTLFSGMRKGCCSVGQLSVTVENISLAACHGDQLTLS